MKHFLTIVSFGNMNARKRLLQAMKELLPKHEINDLTVADITEKADVSKATFYRLYADKFQLAADYYIYNVDTYLSKEGSTFVEMMTNLLIFIQDNRSYFIRLTKLAPPDNFFNTFFTSSLKHTKEKIYAKTNQSLTDKEEAVLSVFLSGCAYMIQQWIQELISYSASELAEILYEGIPFNLKDKFYE